MSDIKTLYDNICKLVLSHPGIIALILKYCTQQYLNQDLEVIKNSIEKNVQKSMQFVHRTNILGISNEFNDINEGKSVFDVITYISDSDNKITGIINIEAQNKSKPGHDTISRAIFCDSRLKSLQYDKSNIIMIYLSQESEYQIIRDLDMLFNANQLSGKEKLAYFKEHYGLVFGDEFEREVNEMCNFSEGIEEKGIEKGIVLATEQGKLDKRLSVIKMIKDLKLNPEEVYNSLGLNEAEREEYTKVLHTH